MKFTMDQFFAWIAAFIISAVVFISIIGSIKYFIKVPIDDDFIPDINTKKILEDESIPNNNQYIEQPHMNTNPLPKNSSQSLQSTSINKSSQINDTSTIKPQKIHHNIYWGYKGPEGPQYWEKLAPEFYLCGEGRSQSPINISTVKEDKFIGKINFNYIKSQAKLFHSGHTIQLNLEDDNYLIFKGKKYTLQQLHFHVPSEHQIKGIKYDGEIHLIHEAEDKSILIVAVLIEEGLEKKGLGLEYIYKYLPTPDSPPINIPFNPAILLPKQTSYYFYEGSLTTPPCSEQVLWIVMSKPISFSSKQIDLLLSVLSFNNRPLQPLNKRTIVYFKNK